MIDAVIFDLDGVLLQSEEVWDEVREQFVADFGGHWHANASRDMMGLSSPEWSSYMQRELGVPMEPEKINEGVLQRMAEAYEDRLPLIPGAIEAVSRMADCWPLGLASSSNRPLIDRALSEAGLSEQFQITVSSEEVDHGKPQPDVFLEVARRMRVAPHRAAAIEDSHNGVQSARAAGMAVILIPNQSFPPGEQAVALADSVLSNLDELTPALVESLGEAE